MKPDLQVTVQVGTVKGSIKQKYEDDYGLLKRVFRERLVEFSKEHPKGDDIPEDKLPFLFTQTKAASSSSIERPTTSLTCVKPLLNDLSDEQFCPASHLPRSFVRWFSRETPLPDGPKTALACLDKASANDHQSVESTSKPPILLNSPMQVFTQEAGVDEGKRRQKLLSSLHSVLDTILHVFRPEHRSTKMTKQEFIHKIISINLDIVDTAELNDQIKLLQEILPDWISETVGLGGDVFICVNLMSSREEIRQRLAEATK